MPKKTRREKMLSAYRKKLKLLEQLNAPVVVEQAVRPEKIPEVKISREKYESNDDEKLIKNFFISDLKKSIFLIGIIIALEIIIYFGTINNYLKL